MELYLWGLPIHLSMKARPGPFPPLVAACQQFEPDIRRMRTEPDVMLHIAGRCLILLEARFASGNTIAKSRAEERAHEKPRSQAGILSRYAIPGRAPAPIDTGYLAAPFFSQLYRNLAFAIWMARELQVEWRLVNLVSELHQRERPDPTPFIHSLLPAPYRQRFVVWHWEHLYRDHVQGQVDLGQLADYLRFKSGNCAKALGV